MRVCDASEMREHGLPAHQQPHIIARQGTTSPPSLIPSLIQLRPGTFSAHRLAWTTQVADRLELRRTWPRRLGKRVGEGRQSLAIGIVGRTRAGRAAPVGPTRRGAARMEAMGLSGLGSTVLTDLLTTALDHPGHGRTEKPSEQGRCDRLDSRGRL